MATGVQESVRQGDGAPPVDNTQGAPQSSATEEQFPILARLRANDLKLNIGCGPAIIPGFINIDTQQLPGVDFRAQANILVGIRDGSCELVYASHVLEHFPRNKVKEVLTEWCRVLKPGGTLRISVPNVALMASLALRSQDLNVQEYCLAVIYGGQTDDYDYHGWGFTPLYLAQLLRETGFTECRAWDFRRTEHSKTQDCSQLMLVERETGKGIPVSLNMEATKRSALVLP